MDRGRVTFLTILVLLPFAGVQARLVYVQLLAPDRYVGGLNRMRTNLQVISDFKRVEVEPVLNVGGLEQVMLLYRTDSNE